MNAGRISEVSAMAARLKNNALAEKLQNRRTVKAGKSWSNWMHSWRISRAARTWRRMPRVHRVADGCGWGGGADRHVENYRLRGGGYGELFGGRQVHVVHRSEAAETKEVRFAEYGTRHRSAFRFVASMEPSVGFIMFQDGGVKAVRQVGSKLVMWPYFQIGFTTALS